MNQHPTLYEVVTGRHRLSATQPSRRKRAEPVPLCAAAMPHALPHDNMPHDDTLAHAGGVRSEVHVSN